MKIYAKIGSMPGQRVWVVRKRKLPVVGDFFKIKTENSRWIKPEGVHLLEIRDLGGEFLYVCERF